ncbi:MAG: sulfite exporter TauE/SafE family protein [Deferribacterales bacterium]
MLLLPFALGALSWFFSTLAGGGGAMIFVPVSGIFFSIQTVAPAVAVAGLLSGLSRIILYRRSINIRVSLLVMPGVIIGAVSGAYLFSFVNPILIAYCLAVFYLLNGVWALFFREKKLFKVKNWYFPIAGAISSFISGIVGVGGPLMNPFYLNYGMQKEMLLGTKAAVVIVMQLFKAGTYTTVGMMDSDVLFIGSIAGIGAVVGNYFGRRFLRKISDRTFSVIVNLMLILCAFIVAFKNIL